MSTEKLGALLFERKNMKSNVKKNKPSIREKFAHNVFCDIIKFLTESYDKSAERDTMTFREYCDYLVTLSKDKVGNSDNKNIEERINEND